MGLLIGSELFDEVPVGAEELAAAFEEGRAPSPAVDSVSRIRGNAKKTTPRGSHPNGGERPTPKNPSQGNGGPGTLDSWYPVQTLCCLFTDTTLVLFVA